MKKRLIPMFTVLAAVGIAYTLHLIFYAAPLQFGLNADGKLNGSSLFFNQKIFYFHTAHAMLLLIGVVLGGVSSILFLLSRTAPPESPPAPGSSGAWRAVADYVRRHGATWDDIASASIDVAVAFGAIALVS